jgi:lipoate---protein ligase
MWMDNWALNIPSRLWPQPMLFRFFVPTHVSVVLSSSNKAEIETSVPEVQRQNVRLLRRKGGGGTVVLSPGCLVLTLAFYAKDIYSNTTYFNAINNLWSDSLASLGLHGVVTLGISDLAINGKKIGGTSLFRRKHLLVYQGSLLVDPNFAEIESLLAHPSREPDYRAGRSHLDFLTSTKAEGCDLTAQQLADHCKDYFAKFGEAQLEPHFLRAV